MGNAVEDQQLSIVWTNNALISVSLSGFINYLDRKSESIERVISGHNKPITALALSPDKSLAFTADFEGNISEFLISVLPCISINLIDNP